MAGFAAYGTSFEELEDEERDAVSKKPTPIQDQVATDERGRRRFHGAFTGGFSAGYFNTVGSKQGWAPQEFRSSRDERFSQNRQRAEDFMDEEDLGEYGISSRRIRQSKDFAGVTSGGNRKAQGELLAWERGSEGKSVAREESSSLGKELAIIIRPSRDSVGVRMLRAMGWRQGRAVGMATMKEAAASRQLSEVDREQLTKVAPHWVASAEDEKVVELQPLQGRHGIGYESSIADRAGLLDQKYGQQAAVLKGKTGKGIRGQAFGVGAFEDEDESVYTSFDLSQYDFSIGPSGSTEKPTAVPDSTFVTATTRLAPRKFFAGPRLPENFRAQHKPVSMDKSMLPIQLQAAAQEMSAIQRSRFFGENRQVLISSSSGSNRKSRWDLKEDERGGGDGERRRTRDDEEHDRRAERASRIEFPSEPMKQARFKEYLSYLRRGLTMPQPRGVTVWEWDHEKSEFETRLLPDERALLPEVMARSKPLAQSALALPLMDLMRNKFIGETNTPAQTSSKDEDRNAAVKAEMFGEKTRQRWDWYPAHGLAKLFNVPHPCPGSSIVGLPHLQGKGKRKEDGLLNLGLPNTAAELAMRSAVYDVDENNTKSRREKTREEGREQDKEDKDGKSGKRSDDGSSEEEQEERPPEEFFAAIFGAIGESSDSEESEVEGKEASEKTSKEGTANETEGKVAERDFEPSEQFARNEKVITVMDMDAEYGPAPPPGFVQSGITGFSAIRFNKEMLRKIRKRKMKAEEKGKDSAKKAKKSKKTQKEKKSRKEKKHKSKKSKKSNKTSSRKSRSSSEEDETETEESSDSDVQALN